jgi:DNA-binding transcriptional regulator of glucitol operon
MVATFLALGWWQAGRAADGNMLSWGYTFEWPLFAIFAVALWIREMRQALRRDRPGSEQPPVTPAGPVRRGPVITRRAATPPNAVEDSSDPRLAAYNRYLAWLNEHPTAKPSDFPG